MIKIIFTNGQECRWKGEQYTDYKYDGKCFIVINEKKWVGIYNIDSIISIIIQ